MLDFLVAVDFLCCDKLKGGVEERIKERIDHTNCMEVLTYTKDFMGLDNITSAVLAVSITRQEKEEENNKKRVLWFNFLQKHQGERWTTDCEEAFWDCDFEEAERLIQEVERLIQEDDDL